MCQLLLICLGSPPAHPITWKLTQQSAHHIHAAHNASPPTKCLPWLALWLMASATAHYQPTSLPAMPLCCHYLPCQLTSTCACLGSAQTDWCTHLPASQPPLHNTNAPIISCVSVHSSNFPLHIQIFAIGISCTHLAVLSLFVREGVAVQVAL